MITAAYNYSTINRLDSLPKRTFQELLAYATQVDYSSIVLVCEYDFPLSKETWRTYMGYLPHSLQRDVMRYRKWEDRHNNLIGKLLVYLGFQLSKKKILDFTNYERTELGKPFIKGADFNFNISHSKKVVVVVHGDDKLGVDVEFIHDVDFKHFESILSKAELEIVQSEGKQKFFEYWTGKEAVSKAIGEGLNIDVAKIACNKEEVRFRGQHWPLLRFIYKDNFFISIASKVPMEDFKILRVQF